VDTTVVLADQTSAVRDARRLVSELLSGLHCPPDQIADAELVISEIVTNAVRHSGGPVELRLRHEGAGVRAEVLDRSSRPPVLLPANVLGERGRGLRIVARLATRWGSMRTRSGKVVWVDLPCRPESGSGSSRLSRGRRGA
jgi:anti-sigma regulatory factor (Ser/Thr protein kinase)